MFGPVDRRRGKGGIIAVASAEYPITGEGDKRWRGPGPEMILGMELQRASLKGMDYRPAAYAVIVNERREILLSHWIGGHWTLPGGGMDPGEHPEDACAREITEETGYKGRLTGLLGVNSHVIPGRYRNSGTTDLQLLQFVYMAEIVGGSMEVEIDGTTDDVGWFRLAEVPNLEHSYLLDFAVGRYLAGHPGQPLASR